MNINLLKRKILSLTLSLFFFPNLVGAAIHRPSDQDFLSHLRDNQDSIAISQEKAHQRRVHFIKYLNLSRTARTYLAIGGPLLRLADIVETTPITSPATQRYAQEMRDRSLSTIINITSNIEEVIPLLNSFPASKQEAVVLSQLAADLTALHFLLIPRIEKLKEPVPAVPDRPELHDSRTRSLMLRLDDLELKQLEIFDGGYKATPEALSREISKIKAELDSLEYQCPKLHRQ